MRRRAAQVRLHWLTTSHIEFMLKTTNFRLVLFFNLRMLHLELVELVSEAVHLRDLVCDLMFIFTSTTSLIIKLGPDLIQQLGQPVVGLGHQTTMRIIHDESTLDTNVLEQDLNAGETVVLLYSGPFRREDCYL